MTGARTARWAALLALAAASIGCGSKNKRFALTGVIQEVPSNLELVVAHEDIPGFMPAMTMPFRLAEPRADLLPGDRIQATLVVGDDASWIEGIRVLMRGLPVESAARPRRASAPGAEVPNFALVNQDGRAIRLHDYRGRALVLTFIYTRCPLPEACPLMMKRFREIDEALAQDPALFARTHLLSVSFDTEHDTPAVLHSFGKAFAKDRGRGRFDHWELASGTREQIESLARFFGLVFWTSDGEITHSLCTVVVAPDGTVAAEYNNGRWTAGDVLARLNRLLQPGEAKAAAR